MHAQTKGTKATVFPDFKNVYCRIRILAVRFFFFEIIAFVRFIHQSLFMAQCSFFFFALVVECCTVLSAGTILIKLQC